MSSSATKCNFAAVVPVFNPEPGLGVLVESLVRSFEKVVVVDDGSEDNSDEFAGLPSCVKLIKHECNRGKGRAIKSAIQWVKEQCKDVLGVVFVDGDGQHRVEDVLKVARCAAEKDTVVLGVRDFSRSGVPFRSRFGNVVTSFLVRRLYGLDIYDSQTGLRAIPFRLLDVMLGIPGERYEYEMRLFGVLHRKKESIGQVSICTIYVENNRTSHFRPIRDSLRVYYGLFGNVFAKFCAASVVGFVVDNMVFTVMLLFLQGFGLVRHWDIMISLVVARVISASVNYACNKLLVFSSDVGFSMSFARYWVLCLLIVLLSYCGTLVLSAVFDANGVVITCLKILVETLLFFLSYKCQQKWVFADEKHGNK